jgi:hypothetical protein
MLDLVGARGLVARTQAEVIVAADHRAVLRALSAKRAPMFTGG